MKNFNLILVLAIGLLNYSCKKEISNSITQLNETFVIKPPILEADIAYETFLINPMKDTVIFQKGNQIKIPKNAFLNENGETISTPVNLKFRSLSNPLEIYLSGVPMVYNENGKQQVFESAGMFDIQANNGGKPVYVNPENKMVVTLESFSNENNFNTYDLQNQTGVWIQTGKDVIDEKFFEEEFKRLPKIPEEPRVANEIAFKLEDHKGVNPDLKLYENYYFLPIDGKPCGQVYNNNIDVKDLKDGTYEITFNPIKYQDKVRTKCRCYIAFEAGESYGRAIKIYRKRFGKQLDAYEKERRKLQLQWEDYNRKVAIHNNFFQRREIAGLTGTKKILRSLEVNNFGFVNVDRPIDYPQGGEINASFTDDEGNPIVLNEVILIEIGKNALYRYKNKIQFNPERENILWGILADGRFAHASIDVCKRLPTSGKTTVVMNVHPQLLKSYDEVMAVLFPK
jgi:hypothetical protein